MPIKVGINGFGRIGRNIMRTALDDKDISVRSRQRRHRREDPRAPF